MARYAARGMGDVERLKAEFAAATDPARRFELVKQLAEAHLAEGNAAEALRAFTAASKFAPNDLTAITGARRAATLVDPQSALDWFDRELKALTDETAKARVYKELGELYQNRLNDFEGAQDAFARARQGDPRVFEERAPEPAPPALPRFDALEPLPELPQLPPPPGGAPAAAPGVVPVAPAPALSSGSVRSASVRNAQKPTSKLVPALAGVALLGTLGVVGVVFGTGTTPRPEAVTCAAELKRVSVNPKPGEEQWDCVDQLTTTRWTLSGTRVIERAQVSNGKLEGHMVRMPSPDVRIEGGYVAGVPSGVWRTLRNDVLESDETYVEGKRNGRAHRYTLDGGVVEEQDWADDVKHGQFKSFSAGKVLLSGSYARDAKSGKWTRYDQAGRPVEVWNEPKGVDAGVVADTGSEREVSVDELFAGQTLSSWRIRHAEVRLEAKKGDDSLQVLLLHRADLAGLKLNAEGTLEPRR